MTRTLLVEAAEHLRRAADAADGETAERFDRVADDLRAAADENEPGPDHGWLDKRTHIVRDAAGDAGEDVQGHADAAVECINEYREDVPGV
ncbi:DUF7553 family protein [Halobaculum magnesiiphilum]|uniref:Uncharacterized protein n=1 Tax=Halobaculum magnesiiphilum TaxID=1017351 RepID=A0A8T8W9A8_9EURY|nr:hypothetical protein [Halobaculum magnesiiphilum]QZP36411.1 hypothetical protein K6T50_08700 [Halobaculum magnesiiphilum]